MRDKSADDLDLQRHNNSCLFGTGWVMRSPKPINNNWEAEQEVSLGNLMDWAGCDYGLQGLEAVDLYPSISSLQPILFPAYLIHSLLFVGKLRLRLSWKNEYFDHHTNHCKQLIFLQSIKQVGAVLCVY